MRTETILYEYKAETDSLDQAAEKIRTLIELEKQQSDATLKAQADVRLYYEQESANIKANLVLREQLAKQATQTNNAELAAQLKALNEAEDRKTIAFRAAEQERTQLSIAEARKRKTEAEEIAKQATAALKAAQKQDELNLKASLAAQQQAQETADEAALASHKASLKAKQAADDAASRQAILDHRASLEAQAKDDDLVRAKELAEFKEMLRQQTLAQKNAADLQLEEHKKVSGGLGTIISSLRDMRTLIGTSFSLWEIKDFVMQIVDAKSNIDRFKMGLTQMLGSKREMNELYADIVKLANETPFEIESLMDTVFNLKGMGVASKELIPTLEALGNMSAVAGQEKLPLIAKAFTDVMNKGKLMKQEINQFAENGIPLYDLLATSMQKPREAIIKLAEDHEISFAQVKKAIMDATSVGGRYYNMMALQAETLGGQISNLNDRWYIAKGIIGDYYEKGLQKVITGTKDMITTLVGSESALKRTETIVEAITVLWGGWTLANSKLIASLTAKTIAETASAAATLASTVVYGTANLVLITLAGTTDMFSAAQVRSAAAARALWLSLAANPIGLVIGLVATATAGYLAWRAAVTDLTTATSQQELALLTEQKTLNASVEAVLRMKEGQKGRADAIQAIINKYPDYFRGMNAEQVTNE
ncbi:MAG: tape measure protein, partial [Williamsia sp.]|nr:tape measure protein [Williamsia sp.]